jgi:hypothetical protein
MSLNRQGRKEEEKKRKKKVQTRSWLKIEKSRGQISKDLLPLLSALYLTLKALLFFGKREQWRRRKWEHHHISPFGRWHGCFVWLQDWKPNKVSSAQPLSWRVWYQWPVAQ